MCSFVTTEQYWHKEVCEFYTNEIFPAITEYDKIYIFSEYGYIVLLCSNLNINEQTNLSC